MALIHRMCQPSAAKGPFPGAAWFAWTGLGSARSATRGPLGSGAREPAIATRRAFAIVADNMIARSRQEHMPLSVVMFRLSDLAELRSIFGDAVAGQILARLSKSLAGMAAEGGVFLRTGADVFTALLPGLDKDAALAAMRQAFGCGLAIELDAGDDEIVVVPDVLIRLIPASRNSIAPLYDEMLRDLEDSRAWEERRQRHLRREHESYCTRPAPLKQAPVARAARRAGATTTLAFP